ncbi:MAG: MATE family efflux transporter [Oscillospiraceae bacterium]
MKKRFVLNTALLTGASVLIRLIGMAFQVWLAGRIGPAGIGLFQLVMSVELLCVTFAVSGIRFAVTRLVAEELGCGRPGGVSAAMRRCCAYSLFFGVAAAAVLRLCAEPIGFLWIGDARTVLSLRVLALGLPFISLSSVLSGYFTACGRVWKPSLVHLLEQLVSVALVAFFLLRSPVGDIEKNCAAVTTGVTVSDLLSFLMMLAAYLGDRRRHGGGIIRAPRMTSRMLVVALPLAASAYARSALSTLEHLLVPRGLKKAGFSADSALAGYGVIQGMVMPIIGFPSCLLLSLAELIVPELTSAQMRRDEAGISRIVSLLLRRTLLFSLACAALLYLFAGPLGEAIYHSNEAGRYIRLLAPLVPIMYTDMVADGCLKGLGQQMWNMAINLLDASLGVLLVWTLLPRGALTAYIAIIYINECINFLLSMHRLMKITHIRLFCRGSEPCL